MKHRHLPCPDCGSSDALTIYENGSFCFSCEKFTPHEEGFQLTNVVKRIAPMNIAGKVKALVSRSITKETAEKYGVSTTDKDTLEFPYRTPEGDAVAAVKKRTPEKDFFTEGDWEKREPLFGMHLFPAGGKYVTITEGEIDAMSVFQMTGSKWPVVSISSGVQSACKDVRKAFEWLDSFENIVVCFDGDEPGLKATKKVAEVFGNKVKIFKHHSKMKDANDYLTHAEEADFINRWWRAEQYVPDGIVAGSSLWDLVNQPIEKAPVMYPFPELNKLTYGIRHGELVTVTAGSGLGKSQFMREILFHILKNTEDNIGCMFLEESVKKTAKSVMSLAINKPLHLPDCEATEEEIKEAFDATMGTERLYFFDHFGSTSVDNIVNRVRYMAKGLDCKYVFLDHVSIIVSAQESGDERKALDEIMTKLRTLVQETGIALFVVSHLKRPESKGHEEGAATSLAQLRGSASIAQLSDIVLGLERNGQAEDEQDRNTTFVRVLKNRFCGLTGPAGSCYYSKETGRMTQLEDEAL